MLSIRKLLNFLLIEADVDMRRLERSALAGDSEAAVKLGRTLARSGKKQKWKDSDIKKGMTFVQMKEFSSGKMPDVYLQRNNSSIGSVWRVRHVAGRHFDGTWDIPNGNTMTVRGPEVMLEPVTNSRVQYVLSRPYELVDLLNSGYLALISS